MRVGPERVVRNNKDGQFRRVVRDEYWGLVVIFSADVFLGARHTTAHAGRKELDPTHQPKAREEKRRRNAFSGRCQSSVGRAASSGEWRQGSAKSQH